MKDQDLYFLIDATASNEFFCQLVSVIQVLVAAFNPSTISNSGTKITAWLFGEGGLAAPSLVFSRSTSCNKTVDERLVSLINEFGKCLDNKRKYTSEVFPPLCGQLTSAVSGLKQIAAEVEKNGPSKNSAMVMLTDGEIKDDETELQAVLKRFSSTIIISGGIQDANVNNLMLYTPSADNILLRGDPTDLGIAIVARLSETGILCAEHGNLSLFKLLSYTHAQCSYLS